MDNDIETSVSVKFAAETPSASDHPSPSTQPTSLDQRPTAMEIDDGLPHGMTAEGDPACCRAVCDGAVDCDECLRAELAELAASLTDAQRTHCHDVLDVLDEAGSEGLSKAKIVEKVRCWLRSSYSDAYACISCTSRPPT